MWVIFQKNVWHLKQERMTYMISYIAPTRSQWGAKIVLLEANVRWNFHRVIVSAKVQLFSLSMFPNRYACLLCEKWRSREFFMKMVRGLCTGHLTGYVDDRLWWGWPKNVLGGSCGRVLGSKKSRPRQHMGSKRSWFGSKKDGLTRTWTGDLLHVKETW